MRATTVPWIPMGERRPDFEDANPEGDVLVVMKLVRKRMVVSRHWRLLSEDKDIGGYTHWSPMPSLPAEDRP